MNRSGCRGKNEKEGDFCTAGATAGGTGNGLGPVEDFALMFAAGAKAVVDAEGLVEGFEG